MSDALPGSGRMDGRAHRFPVRVYYEDTDAANVVYYANYLKFVERARTEMMRLFGYGHGGMRDLDGLAFAVRHCTADYRRPAHLDDALVVVSRVTAMSAARMRMVQAVTRDGETLVTVTVDLVCLRPDGRPGRIPAALREALADHIDPGQPEQ